MKHELSGHIFEKYSNMTFNAKPSSGSRVVPCGPTEEKTDITKLVFAFRNFVNTPKTVIPLTFRVKWEVSNPFVFLRSFTSEPLLFLIDYMLFVETIRQLTFYGLSYEQLPIGRSIRCI
jgi:hypothetical protein